MEIDTDQRTAITGLAGQFIAPQQTGQSFAAMLDADRLKAQTEATRAAVLANQKIEPKNDNTKDIDFIRNKGIRAYTEDIHRKKQEEMREKILIAMGLTEELLEGMTTDQRQAIEDMIAQKILERMAAESMSNGSSKKDEDTDGPSAIGNIDPSNILAAQVLIGDSGALIGLLANQNEKEEALDPTLTHGQKDDDGIG